MSAQTVSDAVAKRDNSPSGLIKTYTADFASVLPSHIKAETWVRLAQGALRKGKRVENDKDPNFGRFELEIAAANNPGVFLASLLDAARLGLEPGTEHYYLTPRKVKGRLEILGIVGYQGHIELIYRAGAVASVIAEVVRQNDHYRYRRGVDEVPVHEYPPFQRESERGPLVGVYAYARMKDGAVSRVVELNADDIARIKASSQGSDSDYSPWKLHEPAMWLKSSVRQLQKWVPTSAEYRREVLRASAEAQRVAQDLPGGPAPLPADAADDGGIIDGEEVGWPDAAKPADAAVES
jgi:recombination protein RecT